MGLVRGSNPPPVPSCSFLSAVFNIIKDAVAAPNMSRVSDVIARMRQHPSVVMEQRNGCGALCGLAWDAENKKLIGATGGIEVVLAAMKQHPSEAGVQGNGCAALGDLPLNNAENQKLIGAAGGIDAVLAAMKQHPSDAKVQGGGCLALNNLADNNAENQMLIVAAGGIEAVEAAMSQHPAVARVQEQGGGRVKCFNPHRWRDRGPPPLRLLLHQTCHG